MHASTEIKTANTHHEVHPLIRSRWSARAFSAKPISQETLNGLFEAASWAASSMNEQPWHYLYAHRGTAGFDRMLSCLKEGNQPWASKAPVLMVALAKKHFERNGQPNRHHLHDVGSANTTLLLQAVSEQIYGHMMGGFHMDQTLAEFDIDGEKWEPACFIAIGYLDDPESLEEPFRSREMSPRERTSIEAFTQGV